MKGELREASQIVRLHKKQKKNAEKIRKKHNDSHFLFCYTLDKFKGTQKMQKMMEGIS